MSINKRSFTLILLIGFVALVAMTASLQAEEKVICQVSGKEIEKSEAAGSLEYKGKTYYFCTTGCKEKFVKDPESFLKTQDEKIICPVMGNEVKDPENADSSEYKGKTYYFCCAGCKPKFDADPEKYIK